MFRRSLWAVAVACLATPMAFGQDKSGTYLGIFGEDAVDTAKKGAIVREVIPDSPAAKAGLKSGDIIMSVNDKAVDGLGTLSESIKSNKVGDKVTMKVWRDGKEESLSVELAAKPENPAGSLPFDFGPEGFRFRIPNQPGGEGFQLPEGFDPAAKRPRVGIQLQAIDESLRERLKLGDVKGALIADVMADSPAAKAELASGDVIVEVDGVKVDNPAVVTSAVNKKKAGENIAFKIVRDGKTLEKTVKVEEIAAGPPFGPGMGRGRGFQLPPGFQMPPGMRGPGQGTGGARFAEMQKRIEELEKKVNDLSEKLEKLQSKPVIKSAPDKPAPEKSADEPNQKNAA